MSGCVALLAEPSVFTLSASLLQVSVWGRRRLGGDAFLGEVVIPLREIGNVASSGAAPEPQTYTLGRRSAREKVMHKALMSHCRHQCIRLRQWLPANFVQPSSVDMHGCTYECKGLPRSSSKVLACLPHCSSPNYQCVAGCHVSLRLTTLVSGCGRAAAGMWLACDTLRCGRHAPACGASGGRTQGRGGRAASRACHQDWWTTRP